jgi:hypothetical protein
MVVLPWLIFFEFGALKNFFSEGRLLSDHFTGLIPNQDAFW